MPNESFYYQATHNQTNKVWDKFNSGEKNYDTSRSYSDERDAKKTNIGTLHNKDENIEDKYFGEHTTIYNQDEKYYKGTAFSPSDGSFSNNKYHTDNGIESDDNVLMYILGGIFLFGILKSGIRPTSGL